MDVDVRQALEELRQKQRVLSQEYDEVVQKIQRVDALQENIALRRQLEAITVECQQLKAQYRQVAEEKLQLQLSLKEQLLDEKLSIMRMSQKKMAAYFATAANNHDNRLTALEAQAVQQAEQLKQAAVQRLEGDLAPVLAELERLQISVRQQIQAQRQSFGAAMTKQSQQLTGQFEQLAAEGVDEAVIRQRTKQNEIELKVGLDWINKLGMLLILFGVGAAAKYSYLGWLSPTLKSSLIFLLGGLLLAGGDWFYRSGKETFATGVLGGAVSVLYCGIFYSYFLLEILGLAAGTGLAVLVTAVAVALAVRYRSRTICALGLIGGYLPFFSYLFAFGLSGDEYYAAMGYLLLLNTAVLAVSFRQKWPAINYISFLLHAPSLLFLVFAAPGSLINIVYTLVSFAAHIGISLAFSMVHRQGLGRADVVLMGLNTLLSSTVCYQLFQEADWSSYYGLLTLVFALVYAGLARMVERRIPEAKSTMYLFYVTATTFAILMIPFQFGVRWLALGWLLEGVVLIYCGLRTRQVQLEKAGRAIFGLCLLAFYLVEVVQVLPSTRAGSHFGFQFFSIVAGMSVVAGAYLHDLKQHGVGRYGCHWEKVYWFVYAAIGHVWLYLLYISSSLIGDWLDFGYYSEFFQLLLQSAVTFALAHGLQRLPLLRDKVVYGISLVLYTAAVFMSMYVNAAAPVLDRAVDNSPAAYGALAILAAYHIMVVSTLRRIIPGVLERQYLNYQLYPLIMLVVGLINISLFINVQLDLANSNLILSMIYLFTAVGAIWHGFRKQFAYVRRLGLALALLSTTKLFLLDLYFLDSLHKILAYFCFGFVLLGISYLYQHLLKGEKEEHGHGKDM